MEAAARAAQAAGQQVVVVLGLGFVGTATAANLGRIQTGGKPSFFVIGLERDDAGGRAKLERLARGVPPSYAEDPDLERVVRTACLETRNLHGSLDPRVLRLAEVVLTCINLDLKRAPGQTEELEVPTEGYRQAMLAIGRHARPGTLVCVESTLPIGTSEKVLYPALKEGLRAQGVDPEREPPLLAYCYERVMPGPGYLDSVNRYWRSYAGIDARSADAAGAFLARIVETASFPLWRHKNIRAAEMAKLLENAYRAANIAFIDEWSRLAEQVGVDLFDVVRSIRVRKGTHDNMMLPGLGVGGYCLTKDAMLAAWGCEELLEAEALMPMSRHAILVNERMPLRAVQLIRDHFGGDLRGRRVACIGLTYRPGVTDTRSSPSEIAARGLREAGAEVVGYDPLLEHWEEMPDLPLMPSLAQALERVDAVVLCLPDASYRDELCALLPSALARGAILVDAWSLVADRVRDELARKGVRIESYGRGDLGGAQ